MQASRYFRSIMSRQAVQIHSLNPGASSGVCGLTESKEIKSQVKNLYKQKMKDWPVKYQNINIQTTYGKTHIIKFGNKNGKPLILLHAMNMTGTLWGTNAAALAKEFQVYAIDYIGDIGLSSLNDYNIYPDTGQKAAEWIDEILVYLEIDKTYLTGASYGGWASLQYTLYKPEKVEKLALIAPMGISPFPASEDAAMEFDKLFSDFSKTNLEEFIRWSIGTNKKVEKSCNEFLKLGLLNGTRLSDFAQLSTGKLSQIDIPVLLIMGNSDKLMGNAGEASLYVKPIKHITIKILNSNHMVNIECAPEVNSLLVSFFN